MIEGSVSESISSLANSGKLPGKRVDLRYVFEREREREREREKEREFI